VVLGEQAASGRVEAREADEADGAWGGGLGHTVTAAGGDRSTGEAHLVDALLTRAFQLQRLLLLAES